MSLLAHYIVVHFSNSTCVCWRWMAWCRRLKPSSLRSSTELVPCSSICRAKSKSSHHSASPKAVLSSASRIWKSVGVPLFPEESSSEKAKKAMSSGHSSMKHSYALCLSRKISAILAFFAATARCSGLLLIGSSQEISAESGSSKGFPLVT